MSDVFARPKQRIGRAKVQLRAMIRQGRAFISRKPYIGVVEPDPNSSDQLHKLKLTRQLPKSIIGTASEAVENLRSALDQAAYITAIASGKIDPKSAYFPVADDAAGLENVIKGRCKDIPPDIIALFRTFNSYKGGNNLVWAINRLCSHSKHRLLGVGMHCDGFRSLSPGILRDGAILGPAWDYERNEIVFGKIEPGGEFKYDFEFSLYVSFGEIPELKGQPAFPVINAAIREIERIVLSIERESKRLGLVT